jgi:hypothetical protein
MSLFKAIVLIESPDTNYRVFEQIVIRDFINMLWITVMVRLTLIRTIPEGCSECKYGYEYRDILRFFRAFSSVVRQMPG